MAVRVDLVVKEPVTLDVDVLELDTERVALGDPVDVFEDDTDGVVVLDTCIVSEGFVDFVNDAEPDDVFDDAIVLVCVPLAEGVFDGGADLLRDGLVEDVLEFELELVGVFVEANERVDVVEPVIVFVPMAENVVRGELLLVRVAAADLVGLFVRMAVTDDSRFVCVGAHVGADVRVALVVFVDVFDWVGLLDGTTLLSSNKRPGRRTSTTYNMSLLRPPPFNV